MEEKRKKRKEKKGKESESKFLTLQTFLFVFEMHYRRESEVSSNTIKKFFPLYLSFIPLDFHTPIYIQIYSDREREKESE